MTKSSKNGLGEEEEAFLPESQVREDVSLSSYESHRGRWRAAWQPRLCLELVMAATIIFLLFFLQMPEHQNVRKNKSPVPQCWFCPSFSVSSTDDDQLGEK